MKKSQKNVVFQSPALRGVINSPAHKSRKIMNELTTTHFITLRFIRYKRPVRGDEVIYNLEVDRFIEKLTVAIKGARHWKRYKRKCLIPGYCQIEFGKLHDFPHAHIAIQKPEWLPEAKFVNAIHAEARRLEWLKSDADAVHVRDIYDQDGADLYTLKETGSRRF